MPQTGPLMMVVMELRGSLVFTMKSLFLATAHAIPHKKVEETGSRAIDTGTTFDFLEGPFITGSHIHPSRNHGPV